MKKYLDKWLPWRVQIRRLKEDLLKSQAENSVLQRRNADLSQQLDSTRQGNAIALSFIHKTHHLGAPFSEQAIRDRVPNR